MAERELTGQVGGVFIRPERGSWKTVRLTAAHLDWGGLNGDVYAGLTRPADARTPQYPRGTQIQNTRQLSIASAEKLEEFAAALGLSEAQPELPGAHVALWGIPAMTYLPPSTRSVFPQEGVLVVDGENPPCTRPRKIIQENSPDGEGLVAEFPKAALRSRRLLAWVGRPGRIPQGRPVRGRIPSQVRYLQ